MARVIIGVHGLGNKPDKDTLYEWWRLSMMEGIHNFPKSYGYLRSKKFAYALNYFLTT